MCLLSPGTLLALARTSLRWIGSSLLSVMAETSVGNTRRHISVVWLWSTSSLLQSGWAGICAPDTEGHLSSIRMLRACLYGALGPLGQPEKAIGQESQIELWSPN
jgi:hypothetical protein